MKHKIPLWIVFCLFCACAFSQESAPGATQRILADFFTPCTTTTIRISVNVEPQITAWAIEDSPPENCEIVHISHGGVWDSRHNKIKWGFYFREEDRNLDLSYDIIIPGGREAVSSFSGRSAYDGIVVDTSGDSITFDSGITPRDLVNHILGKSLLSLEKFIAGDLNRDNMIDICDVVILVRATSCNKGELMGHLLGVSPIPEKRIPSFDFNQDGVIDSADLIDMILNPRCCN